MHVTVCALLLNLHCELRYYDLIMQLVLTVHGITFTAGVLRWSRQHAVKRLTQHACQRESPCHPGTPCRAERFQQVAPPLAEHQRVPRHQYKLRRRFWQQAVDWAQISLVTLMQPTQRPAWSTSTGAKGPESPARTEQHLESCMRHSLEAVLAGPMLEMGLLGRRM